MSACAAPKPRRLSVSTASMALISFFTASPPLRLRRTSAKICSAKLWIIASTAARVSASPRSGTGMRMTSRSISASSSIADELRRMRPRVERQELGLLLRREMADRGRSWAGAAPAAAPGAPGLVICEMKLGCVPVAAAIFCRVPDGRRATSARKQRLVGRHRVVRELRAVRHQPTRSPASARLTRPICAGATDSVRSPVREQRRQQLRPRGHVAAEADLDPARPPRRHGARDQLQHRRAVGPRQRRGAGVVPRRRHHVLGQVVRADRVEVRVERRRRQRRRRRLDHHPERRARMRDPRRRQLRQHRLQVAARRGELLGQRHHRHHHLERARRRPRAPAPAAAPGTAPAAASDSRRPRTPRNGLPRRRG